MRYLKYLLLFLPMSAFAQAPASSTSMWDVYPAEIAIPVVVIVCLLAILILALSILAIEIGSVYRKKLINDGATDIPWLLKLFGVFEGDAEAFTGTYQDELIQGHEYDGIREFDNDLPPWWVYMFYATIIFSVIYMLHYHVFKTGQLQEEEFQAKMELAEEMYADVDQEYEGPTDDQALLSEGQALFVQNCAVCHKEDLGGTIGPNLTDDCWKFGGNVNDIYKTIKYGQAPKMPEWQNSFTNEQIYAITSYVLSMQGSNPEGGLPCEK